MTLFFARFSLTETDPFGILPTDLSPEEAHELKLEVKKNKARGLTTSKRPKTTKPKKSLAPSEKGSKTPKGVSRDSQCLSDSEPEAQSDFLIPDLY